MAAIEITVSDIFRIEAALTAMGKALAIRRRKRREVAVIRASNSLIHIINSFLQRSTLGVVND